MDQPSAPTPPAMLLDGLNTLRAILVAMAFFASIYLAFNGQWLATLVLSIGIVAHGLMWVFLLRQQRRQPPAL